MKQRLAIFARYPDPGRTKTRLIPALGPDAAAALSRKMAGLAVSMGRTLPDTELELRFSGGSARKFRKLFGAELSCRKQYGLDLGERMANAFADGFNEGCGAVVIIGTDCPFVTAEVINEAFERLADSDIVIGPASDGGYYLIGMRGNAPALFEGIEWGTASVFEATLAFAEEQGLTVSLLSELNDIDRPEDLALLQEHPVLDEQPGKAECLSVIIPVLNEAGTIKQTIQSVQSARSVEIIVSDGGSDDGTVEAARSCGVTVIEGPAGRAGQANRGAAAATGDMLLFLHADTVLPTGYLSDVMSALEDDTVYGGAFSFSSDRNDLWKMRVESWMINRRSRVRNLPYGDQALFLRTATFHELGGFTDIPLMEDYDFVLRLRRLGRLVILDRAVVTSARRWLSRGIIAATIINQVIIAGFHLGVPAELLAKLYRSFK